MLHLERAPARAALSGEVHGALINLSGRRRFTSQRVVLYAVLAAQGRDGALQTAADALRLFADAHRVLVEGDARMPGVFCDELRDAYFGDEPRAEKTIGDFIALAQRTLDAIASRMRAAPALLDELVDGATPLLAVLNRITQVHEELARRHALRARQQLVDVMGEIESIARQARIVSFNGQVAAARAGACGREFSVVAGQLSQITGQIDELVREALRGG